MNCKLVYLSHYNRHARDSSDLNMYIIVLWCAKKTIINTLRCVSEETDDFFLVIFNNLKKFGLYIYNIQKTLTYILGWPSSKKKMLSFEGKMSKWRLGTNKKKTHSDMRTPKYRVPSREEVEFNIILQID